MKREFSPLAYAQPKTHIPRQPGYTPAPPSRWNNPATRYSGGGGSPANRPGKTYTPGKYKGNPNRKVQPKPFRVPSPGKKYVPRPASETVRERVRRAVEKAFPNPRPYGGVPRAVASAATRYGEAVAESQKAWEEATSAQSYVDEVIANQWWQQTPPYEGPNAGLTFLEARKHTNYVAPNYPPPGNAGWTSAVDARTLAQNTWLRSTTFAASPVPTAYLARTLTVGQTVPANHFLYIPNEDYYFITGSPKNFYAHTRIYRNNTGAAMPAIVTQPAHWPAPLGAPIPVGTPSGYPLARAAEKLPRPLPRPKRYEEVAIELPPISKAGRGPKVYPTRPRKPGPKAKETKSYGKSGAASAAFWAYEATDDWTDWVNILISAIPGSPTGLGPLQQMEWLIKNPGAVARANWDEVIAGLAGWLVDETFGAAVGDINKRATRSTAVSVNTVDMRTNAPLHYSPGGGSPGAFVRDFILAFL